MGEVVPPSEPVPDAEPSVDGAVAFAQIALGLGAGVAGAYAGFELGTAISGDSTGGGDATSPGPQWLGAPRGGLIGMIAVPTLAIPAAVALGTYGQDVDGSYLAALGGTAVGMTLGVAVATQSRETGMIVLAIAPLAGAMVGYNYTLEATPRRRGGMRTSWVPMPVLAPDRAMLAASGTF